MHHAQMCLQDLKIGQPAIDVENLDIYRGILKIRVNTKISKQHERQS